MRGLVDLAHLGYATLEAGYSEEDGEDQKKRWSDAERAIEWIRAMNAKRIKDSPRSE